MFKKNSASSFLYKIEINRVENELERSESEPGYEPDLTGYETILGIKKMDQAYIVPADMLDKEFSEYDGHYVLKNISGSVYRIDYKVDLSYERREIVIIVNIILGTVIVTAVGILAFLYFSLIKTFGLISDYPEELSKGHMVPPLPAKRIKYFGKFLWGLDVLREKLEEEKKKNLELQKERNVFLLSLSHDIKTPLSAIKLYAASVRKNLYKDEDRIREVAEKIDYNANVIESYVAKIISASNDDFLSFNVNKGEFYLSEVVNYIKGFYGEKLKAIGTELIIPEFTDALIEGDKERFIEVLQNIFENAVKYGDGQKIGMDFSDEEEYKLITVSNTGCTLSPDETGHIFDSFYRGSNVGNNSGSGLGLYICKKLMIMMNGDIYAGCPDGEMRITLVCSKR
jgi:signal transduction histidine kinase